MLDYYKDIIIRQYEAALCMLNQCVEPCPDKVWNKSVVNLTFNQAVFHALFFTDLYLGADIACQREQPFHKEHAATFADYEELQPRQQVRSYSKAFITQYMAHVRSKAGETEESLQVLMDFNWVKVERGELHVYNIRHIQHHAAQLGLKLRMESGEGIGWVGSGWRTT